MDDSSILEIVDILFPPNEGDIWKGLAGNLAKGLICYLLDTEKNQLEENKWNNNIKVIKPTIPLMMKLGTDKGGYSSFIERALKEHEDEENPLSEATRAAFNEFLEMHDKGRSSVLMTFNSEMKVYTNPTCAAALSDNDFDFENLFNYFEQTKVEAVVLGCTHFPYIKEELEKITKLSIIDVGIFMIESLKSK